MIKSLISLLSNNKMKRTLNFFILATLFIPQNNIKLNESSIDIKKLYIEKNYKKIIQNFNKIKNPSNALYYILAKSLFFERDYENALNTFAKISNDKFLEEFKNIYIAESLLKLNQIEKLKKHLSKCNFSIDILQTQLEYIKSELNKNDPKISFENLKNFLEKYQNLNYNWRIKNHFIKPELYFESFTNIINITENLNDKTNFLKYTLSALEKNFKSKKFFLLKLKNNFKLSEIQNHYQIFVIAREFYYNNFFEDAESLFKELIIKNSINYQLKSYYFLSLIYKNNYEKSIEQLKNGVIIFNSSNESLYYLAKGYFMFDKVDEAIQNLNKILNSTNKNFKKESCILLTEIYQKKNDTQKEEETLLKAINEFPDDYEICKIFYKKALIFLNSNQNEKAKKFFEILSNSKFFKNKSFFFLAFLTKNNEYFKKYLQSAELDWFYVIVTENLKLKKNKFETNLNEITFGKLYKNISSDPYFKNFEFYAKNGLTAEAEIFFKLLENKFDNKLELYKTLLYVSVENDLLYWSLRLRYKILVQLNLKSQILSIPKKYKKYFFPEHYSEVIETILKDYKIEKEFIYSIILQESFFNVEALSHAGAEGLFQIMPSTANIIIKNNKIEMDDLTNFNPYKNALIGINYIDFLLKKYKNDYILTLSAYNAGEKNVDKWKNYFNYNPDEPYSFIELIPYEETKNFVKKCLFYYHCYKNL